MNSFLQANGGYHSEEESESRTGADSDEHSLSTINVIANNVNKMIRANLDSVWYQLSARARRTLRDVQLLKSLLFHLTTLDAVSFYGELKHIRTSVTPDSHPPDWLFWTPTETLFQLTEQRVYRATTTSTGMVKRVYNIEMNPKLDALNTLLHELERECKDSGDDDPRRRMVVIVCENQYAIRQIENLRDKGKRGKLVFSLSDFEW